MTARTRTRSKTIQGSQKIMPSGSTPSYTQTPYTETCLDEVGDLTQDNPFTLNRTERRVVAFTGDTKTSPSDTTYATDYDGYWPTYARTVAVNHSVVSGAPSDNEMGINVVSRTNPSRPVVDIPLSIAELRDLPAMLKSVTRQLRSSGKPLSWPEMISGNILTVEFGIKPLVSDIRKLLDFQSQFAKKTKILEQLYYAGGYRGKTRGGNFSAFDRINVTADSSAGTIKADVDRLTVQSVWATTRWRPDPNSLPPSTPEELHQLARSIVYSGKPSLQTLWNAMPWTWLADWFGNAGDYLGTFNNAIPTVHSPPCVMRHTKTTYTGRCDRSSYPNLKGGDFVLTRETKTRVIMPFLLPEARIPFLDARQVSILGSLGVTRIPRHLL